jgi:response regulator of citrate/malate metabolism
MGSVCIAVVGHCSPSPQHLDLSGLVDVTDETVMVILQHSGRKLVSLNLSGCIKISNVSIRAVAKYCGKHRAAMLVTIAYSWWQLHASHSKSLMLLRQL